MEQTNQSFLATEKLGRLMQKYAIPCIISLLVGALYNIVDQIFIANADYLGSYGNAANTVVFPLTVIALAIAVMIGDGCCAFVSLSLGKKRPEDANTNVGNAIVLTVASGIILCVVYLLFQEPIIAMFGGTVNAETFRHSKEYFFYISLGIPFYMFGQAANPAIRADGSPKFAMVSTLAGAIINIILDPIFIFIFKWGMMGAAVATVFGQIVTAVLAVWYFMHTKVIRLSKSAFRLKSGIVRHSLTLGICSFLSQISLVAAMAAINNMIRQYGGMYSDCRIQHGCRIKIAGKQTIYKTSYLRGCRRCDCTVDCRIYAKTTDCHFRRGKRKCLLHGFCNKGLPHLPMHDRLCLRKQGDLHLLTSNGKSGGFHRPFNDS
jgi:Na+-driven multidrug efflux pump